MKITLSVLLLGVMLCSPFAVFAQDSIFTKFEIEDTTLSWYVLSLDSGTCVVLAPTVTDEADDSLLERSSCRTGRPEPITIPLFNNGEVVITQFSFIRNIPPNNLFFIARQDSSESGEFVTELLGESNGRVTIDLEQLQEGESSLILNMHYQSGTLGVRLVDTECLLIIPSAPELPVYSPNCAQAFELTPVEFLDNALGDFRAVLEWGATETRQIVRDLCQSSLEWTETCESLTEQEILNYIEDIIAARQEYIDE